MAQGSTLKAERRKAKGEGRKRKREKKRGQSNRKDDCFAHTRKRGEGEE